MPSNVLIDAGVLRGFVFDTTAARRAGVASTASAVRGGYATTPAAGCRALLLAPGTLGADEILAQVGDGLYVQSITGVHSGVNPVSGDFSVGAEVSGARRRAGRAGARGHDRVDDPRMLQRGPRRRRRGAAAGLASGKTLAVDGMALSGA